MKKRAASGAKKAKVRDIPSTKRRRSATAKGGATGPVGLISPKVALQFAPCWIATGPGPLG
jgi:hypothetical protein